MRRAAFIVRDGEREVEITVIDLAPAVGEVLPNVNRWRGQVRLPPTTQAEIDRDIKKLKLGDIEADYVQLVGPAKAKPRETILAAIALAKGKAWFFKLKGDAELAQRERERFEAFVKSVRFNKANGAGNGKH